MLAPKPESLLLIGGKKGGEEVDKKGFGFYKSQRSYKLKKATLKRKNRKKYICGVSFR